MPCFFYTYSKNVKLNLKNENMKSVNFRSILIIEPKIEEEEEKRKLC